MRTGATIRSSASSIITIKGGNVASDDPELHQPPEPEEPDEHEDEHSTQGTMVLMLFFLVVIIGVWGTMFLLLLDRG